MTRLYISNLDPNTSVAEILTHASQVGTVSSISFCGSFAFVTLECGNAEEARSGLDSTTIGGQIVTVQIAKADGDPRSSQLIISSLSASSPLDGVKTLASRFGTVRRIERKDIDKSVIIDMDSPSSAKAVADHLRQTGYEGFPLKACVFDISLPSSKTSQKSMPMLLADEHGQTPVCFLVSRGQVGAVLGTGGGNIRKVQDEFKMRVNFLSENVYDPSNPSRPFLMTATPEAQLDAAIAFMVENLTSHEEHKEVNIYVPHILVGPIVGRGGSHLVDIHQRTGSSISISRLLPNFKFLPRLVTIKGGNIAAAVAEMHAVMQDNVHSDQLLRLVSQDTTPPREETIVLIPDKFVGHIIGKNGRVIREMSHQTHTSLDIDTTSQDFEEAKPLTIAGPWDAHQHALKAIYVKLQEATRSESMNDHSNESRLPAVEIDVRFALAPGAAGYIVGKHGSVIRELRTLSGAVVDLDSEEHDSTNVELTITGTFSQVLTAMVLARQVLVEHKLV